VPQIVFSLEVFKPTFCVQFVTIIQQISTSDIILSAVLYGCDTWSLTLRKEHGLRVSENRLLRRKFGPKREEVAGEKQVG